MAKKYKPLKDLQKESLRVRLTNTRDSLANRAEGLDVSAEKLRETGLTEAAVECDTAAKALQSAHERVAAFIEQLEQEDQGT